MSSILDALNKAEEERAAQEYALSRGFDDLADGDVEDELTGRTPANGARGVSLTPLRVFMLAAVFMVVVAAASGGAAWVVFHLRGERGPVFPGEPSGVPQGAVAAVVPTLPEPAPRINAQPVPADVNPVPADAAPAPETAPPSGAATPSSVPPPEEATVEETPAPAPVTDVEDGGESEPEDAGIVAPGPDEAPVPRPAEPPVAERRVQLAAVDTPRPAVAPAPAPLAPAYPETERVAPRAAAEPAVNVAPAAAAQDAPRATKRVEAGEVDVLSLPELTDSDRRRLGLPEITVNVVGRPSKYRPQPSAMINFSRVVLNEFIPGTRAQLIGVSVHGVGIQVGGERYFVPK